MYSEQTICKVPLEASHGYMYAFFGVCGPMNAWMDGDMFLKRHGFIHVSGVGMYVHMHPKLSRFLNLFY